MYLLYSFLRCIDTYGLWVPTYGQKRRLFFSVSERACHARHVDPARVSPTLTPTASGHATWHTNVGAGRALLIPGVSLHGDVLLSTTNNLLTMTTIAAVRVVQTRQL